jgi:uncharacterized protein YidB (DUF937 family)
MSEVTSTNIRVGPGVYLALKEMAEKSGMTIGNWANLLLVGGLLGNNNNLSGFRPEIQKAVVADALSALGELLKAAGLEAIRDTSISQLYQNLLNQPKDSTRG